MRSDATNFIAENQSNAKTPHYTVELAFDDDFTVLRYITDSADSKVPTGGSRIDGSIISISGSSQRVRPERAISTIGAISINVADVNNAVRDLIADQLDLGRSLKAKRVRVYVGFGDIVWDDYSLVETQIVDSIEYLNGQYSIKCADIQREARKDIFDLAKTTLTFTIDESTLVIPVAKVSNFEFYTRGAAYTDSAPSPDVPVQYIKIDDEVIRVVSTTTDPTYGLSFVADKRGALNTKAAGHVADSAASSGNRKAVTEFVYIEMPAVKLIYALLTGVLLNSGSPQQTLPSNWHLGIDESYANADDFNNIGIDLYDTANDANGLVVRFEGTQKQDGKQFIEQQLAYLIGAMMPVYSDGSLGLKRIPRISADSAYVRLLDDTNIVSYSTIKHEMRDVLNVLNIEWNWDHIEKKYTRTSIQIDSDSVAIFGGSQPKTVKFLGLHGSRHKDEVIAGRFEAIRDRYSGPPQYMSVKVLPSNNDLEVGDIVRVQLDQIHDYDTKSTLDRSFEIQQVSKNWITGEVTLTLFGSVRSATPAAPTIGATVLADSFYQRYTESPQFGVELEAYLNTASPEPFILIGGVGHIQSDATLTGDASAIVSAAVFSYAGDLTIDSGVTLTISDNVQLRVMGHLTINGTINGVGNGIAAGGAPGYIGSTLSGGGINMDSGIARGGYFNITGSYRGASQSAVNFEAVHIELQNTGDDLIGLPPELRGTPGLVGGDIEISGSHDIAGTYAGGAGGAGGAGLMIICRGASFGAAGSTNVSGVDGSLGVNLEPNDYGFGTGFTSFNAGSGGGGSPGAVYFFIDGSSASRPLLSRVTGILGDSLVNLVTLIDPGFTRPIEVVLVYTPDDEVQSYYIGFSQTDQSDSIARSQFIPGSGTVEQDPDLGIISPPTGLSIASGTDELIVETDGTIVVRARLSWTASTDERVVGYEVQYKTNAGSIWYTGPTVIGGVEAYVLNLQSGVLYDFRVRAATGFNQSSTWLTATSITIIGKTEDPPDCDTFLVQRLADGTREFDGGLLPINVPADFAGYKIRAAAGSGSPTLTWDDLTDLHKGVITALPWETNQLAAGTYVAAIKAVDTTGNVSTNDLQVISTLGDPRLAGVLLQENPRALGWPGTLTDCWVAEDGNLYATDSLDWASFSGNSPVTTWADWTSWARAPNSPIIYEHTQIDIGTVSAFTPQVTVTSNGDTITTEERHSDGDASPWTWSSWTAVGSQVTGRYIEIRTTITKATGLANITQMNILLDAEVITEFIEDLDTSTLGSPIAAGEFRLPITTSYSIIRQVNIALQNVGAGWSWEIIDKNVTLGPRIRIYDETDTLADATIDAEIKGL